MTLAVVLLLSSFTSNPAATFQPKPQAAQTAEPAIQSAPQTEQQTANPQAQSAPSETKPSSSAQSPATSQKTATTKRKHHKKKVASSNCGVRPMPAQPATPASNPQGANPQSTSPADPAPGSPTASASGQAGTATAAQDCPPKKTIVRHGGTSEPSIQLAGGPTDSQAAHQRDVVNQLLGVTENNLKKVGGKQLSSNQQDTLSQARVFVKQSKDAIASGDLDRARTLAWKAETLSEDLIKP
ncbi:MAG TPA: hypothetical protein VKQ11_20120 [Candidatus Sulfotelmatobacter sp.]|nr:hypothetical protein [Candidatus Sulfotelmatobacter sp.]